MSGLFVIRSSPFFRNWLIRHRSLWTCLAVLLGPVAGGVAAEPARIGDIQVRHAAGQTYVMWKEAGLAPTTRLAVYVHDEPITEASVEKATVLSRDLMPGTSCDLADLRNYRDKDKDKGRRPAGYRRFTPLPTEGVRGAAVPWGGKVDPETGCVVPGRLEPCHGLYVRTPSKPGKVFYAVAAVDDDGGRLTRIVPGESALTRPVNEKPTGELAPIQVAGPPLRTAKDSPRKSLFVALHAISGHQHEAKAAADVERRHFKTLRHYIAYGTVDQGWREGIPFQWTVYATDPEHPTGHDRYELWPDDSNFAFMGFGNAWWYGVNRNITRPDELAQGVVHPQHENRLVALLDWTLETYPIDRDRVAMYGASMGGTGALAFAARHPEYFSALELGVPAVRAQKLPGIRDSARIIWGPMDKPIRTTEGISVWERIDTTRQLREHPVRLPIMHISHGRTDHWMRWEHNPAFYRMMQDQGQPLVLLWDPKGHGGRTCYKTFHEAIPLLRRLHYISRNEPWLAFANGSANDDLGDGDPNEGTPEGVINLYYRFDNAADKPGEFSVDYWYDKRGDTDGGTVDLIPNRIQKLEAGKDGTVSYRILDGEKVVRDGVVKKDRFGVYRINGAPADKRYRLVLEPERNGKDKTQ